MIPFDSTVQRFNRETGYWLILDSEGLKGTNVGLHMF